MIAVTIGVGPLYEALALLSARCINETTGLEAVVLKESDLRESGLLHPAALKLKIFEFIQSENILYFDADWFSVNSWNPNSYKDKKSIIACHDFVLLDDWPEQYMNINFDDYEEYFCDPVLPFVNRELRFDYIDEIERFNSTIDTFAGWINTGFWIANKKNHECWLLESLRQYNGSIGHHPQYYEQPAMNKVISQDNLKIEYLGRKYNVLVSTRKIWPSFLIGLHVKVKHNKDFVGNVIKGKISTLSQVQEFYFHNYK